MSEFNRRAELALELGQVAGERLVIAEETAAVHLRWAGNALTSNGVTRDRRLTVVVLAEGVDGASAGVVSRGGALDEAAIGELVRAADEAARQARPAPDARQLLGAPEALAGQAPAAAPAASRGLAADGSADWSAPAATVDVADLAELAAELAVACRRAAEAGQALFGYAEQQVRTTCLASSTGLRLRHVQPTAVVDITARTADGSASAWAGTGLTTLAGFDAQRAAADVRARLRWARRRVELPAGHYEVLLPPACVADLMVRLYRAAGGRDAADGRSAFGRTDGGSRIGERLTDALLTLRSDPRARGLECAPFVVARADDDVFTQISAGAESVFDNGLPLSPTNWITDGVLTALVHTRASAQLTGQPLTPRIDNLMLAGPPGGCPLADMIARTRRGLLLTSLWYVRDVDPATMLLTGLTRDGVYLVEDGEVTAAVNNFRFHESPLGVLARVREIGQAERTIPREWGDYFTRVAMPALRVRDFTMSAPTRAT